MNLTGMIKIWYLEIMLEVSDDDFVSVINFQLEIKYKFSFRSVPNILGTMRPPADSRLSTISHFTNYPRPLAEDDLYGQHLILISMNIFRVDGPNIYLNCD